MFGIEDEPWQELAECAQGDPESFFPEKGGSTAEAKRICGVCQVRAECLDTALANDERFGIWGGLVERDRRKVRQLINDHEAQSLPATDDTPTREDEAS